ncbi:TPA: aspartyl/asparaginyl beta-hydroxylase domain-containing protein [Stenotrophomonas maltophilia]|nr:aspartyl/asparaginyl beta-hydroxylase domain-containing protein [Stenotrophomonas maltophilia]
MSIPDGFRITKKMASRIVGTGDLASYDFRQDIQYLNSVEKQPEEYDEFAQGYWKNLSLLNSSGCMDDSQYKNCAAARATGHMVRCPEIARMLEETFNLEIVKMVRARNLMDGMVIPHRDFVELDPELSYFRVFIPIEYNQDSYHSDVGGVFQMRPGEVWFLDAAVSHAAINFSSDSRMFICLDFVFDGEFNEKEIFRDGVLVPGRTRDIHISRPALSEDDLADIIGSITSGISRHNLKEHIFECSRVHFRYDVHVTACYDWLIQGAVASGDEVVTRKLRSLKRFLVERRAMDERFTFEMQ